MNLSGIDEWISIPHFPSHGLLGGKNDWRNSQGAATPEVWLVEKEWPPALWPWHMTAQTRPTANNILAASRPVADAASPMRAKQPIQALTGCLSLGSLWHNPSVPFNVPCPECFTSITTHKHLGLASMPPPTYPLLSGLWLANVQLSSSPTSTGTRGDRQMTLRTPIEGGKTRKST